MKHIRPWCGLCRFPFDGGDDITVVDQNDVLKGLKYDPVSLTETKEKFAHLYFPFWGEISQQKLVTGCHSVCIDYLERNSAPRSNFMEVTEYEFTPSPLEFERRCRWLEQRSASGLCIKSGRLNQDVAVRITRHCLSELALVYLQSRSGLPAAIGIRNHVQTTSKVWARWITFEGVLYITTLSNDYPRDQEKAYKNTSMLRMPSGTIGSIYVAHDHLGIRNVLFADSMDVTKVSRCPGLWWETIPLEGRTQLACYSDGVKLRRINPDGLDSGPRYNDELWAVPWPYSTSLRFSRLCPRPRGPQTPRMNFFECNASNIRAYSACWRHRIITIHTHTHAEEDFKFYQAWTKWHPNAVWLYMPVDEDEFITEIWKRPSQFRDFDLVMKTNRDRIWTIGPQLKNPQAKSWILLDQPKEEPDRIFIEENWFGIRQIAFKTPQPAENQNSGPIEIPQSPHPIAGRYDNFFYTSAPLTDVVLVCPCQCQVDGVTAIIGLLLYYKDGRERSVGQIRLDLLQPCIEVQDSTHMGLKLSYNKQKIFDLRVCEGLEGDEWFSIPWIGCLDWWYSGTRCELHHKNNL